MTPDNQIREVELDELISFRLNELDRPEVAHAIYDGIRHKFPELPKREAHAVAVSIWSRVVEVLN